MIGLSLSRCILDLIQHKSPVPEERVVKIYCQLIIKNEQQLERVIERYNQSYWQKYANYTSVVVRRLFWHNKLVSPRLVDDKHYPITITGYWVENEAGIWWNDKPETAHGPAYRSPEWAFGIKSETPYDFLKWAYEYKTYPVINIKKPEWFERSDFNEWLAESSINDTDTVYVEYNKYYNGTMVTVNRGIPKDIMDEVKRVCEPHGYDCCIAKLNKF